MVFENVSADALGNIYIGLLGLAVLLYAILDGYDLGVGVLLPPRNEKFRDDMIASIGPYWTQMKPGWYWRLGYCFLRFPKHTVRYCRACIYRLPLCYWA